MKSKILIIEDNEQNMYLMTYILEKSGYSIIQATDGFSGIKSANLIKPDFILLDIQLPGMDGYEIAKRLRQNDKLDGIPIVAVTSYAMVGDKERTLEAGCTGYIEKPINPSTFVDEIRTYLNKKY